MHKQPPQENQFKKGESGNPKGRPKNNTVILLDMAEEFIRLLGQAKAKDRQAIEKVRAINEIMKK